MVELDNQGHRADYKTDEPRRSTQYVYKPVAAHAKTTEQVSQRIVSI